MLARLLLSLLILMLAACASRAPDNGPTVVGWVAMVQGSPQVFRGADDLEIGVDSALRFGDVLVTDRTASVQARMKDRTRFTLGGGGQLALQIAAGEEAPRWTLLSGTLSVVAARSTNLVVSTPSAEVRARGKGDWRVTVDEHSQLAVCLLKKGELQVVNEFGSVRIDRQGFGTTANFSEPPAGVLPCRDIAGS